MRKLLFAVVLLVFGGITFAAATPVRALESGTLNGTANVLLAGTLTKAQWHHHRHHHWRHRHWRHRHWYPRHCRRYCFWRYGHRHCYRRCWRRRWYYY